MAHLSEGSKPLEVKFKEESFIRSEIKKDEISLLIFPYFEVLNNETENLKKEIYNFIERQEQNSVVAILTSPLYAADVCNYATLIEHFKQWISIELEEPLSFEGYIPLNHCALIIFAKYKKSLQHSRMRISYNYCPACEKTSKDYGGKKHLYHEFGTLMSDVWKDIKVNFNVVPNNVIYRLKDLLGVNGYESLNVFDERYFFQYSLNSGCKTNGRVGESNSSLVPEIKLESTLLNGDCIEKLKELPSESIDFCFADPPYNLQKKYNSWNDGLDIKQYFDWCDVWLSELARVLKPGRTLAVLNIPKWAIRHFAHLNKILSFQDWIVWEGLSIPSKDIVPVHYSIICFTKGSSRQLPSIIRNENSKIELSSQFTLVKDYCLRPACIKQRRKAGINDQQGITNLWWDIHRLMHNSRRVDHPCQLPPSLMHRLISMFTFEEEIVLDPFNGVGTTTLCAELLNRKYLGIELSEYYHNIAIERHNEIKSGIDPFRKRDELTPKVKNSRISRLEKQKYAVSKKKLQLEVKRISSLIGKLPSKEELYMFSQYPAEYYEKYFVNWIEVYAAAKTTGMTDEKRSDIDQLKIFS